MLLPARICDSYRLLPSSFASFRPDTTSGVDGYRRAYIAHPEIVQRIFQYCTWSAVVDLMHVNSAFRAIGFRLLRFRITFFLRDFFHMDRMEAFFELLDSTEAMVAGGVVRSIMSLGSFDYFDEVKHDHLTIVVPYDNGSNGSSHSFFKWRRFVMSCGYHELFVRQYPPHMYMSPTATQYIMFVNVSFPWFSFSFYVCVEYIG